MRDSDEVAELEAKRACYDCVQEEFLHQLILDRSTEGTCNYCGTSSATIGVKELKERVSTAFEQHYYKTPNEPNDFDAAMMSNRELNYEWYREGMPVVEAIEDAGNMNHELAKDIASLLEYENQGGYDRYDFDGESEFCSDSHYDAKPAEGAEWHKKWSEFEHSLKHEARLVNHSGLATLDETFADLDNMFANNDRPLIVKAGPNTEFEGFYRARSFQSESKLIEAMKRPDILMGPPSPHIASAGRMNALGISVFYGSLNAGVALKEVRPPVGSKVATVKFNLTRNVMLLDLSAVSDVSNWGYSVFDPTFYELSERKAFLKILSEKITKPVMPDDEGFEYLSTQAIADYLSTQVDTQVDGILFPSVQSGDNKINVILFNKAARVELLDIPIGTEVGAWTGHNTDDGWEVDYTVFEKIPKKEKDNHQTEKIIDDSFSRITKEAIPCSDKRPITLRVDTESMRVHRIDGVSFDTDDHDVSRNRWEKHDEF